MGQQVLAVIALHEKNTLQLPCECVRREGGRGGGGEGKGGEREGGREGGRGGKEERGREGGCGCYSYLGGRVNVIVFLCVGRACDKCLSSVWVWGCGVLCKVCGGEGVWRMFVLGGTCGQMCGRYRPSVGGGGGRVGEWEEGMI